MRKTAKTVLAATALSLVMGAPQASAATTVGQVFNNTTWQCGGGGFPGLTLLQAGVASGTSYSVPSDGVITSWSFHEGAEIAEELWLKVGRPAGGDSYTMVGRSQADEQVPDTASTNKARIPVRASDVIGIFTRNHDCFMTGTDGDRVVYSNEGNLPTGETHEFKPSSSPERIPVSAQVEPDRDRDGYGDETQDLCPDLASETYTCPKLPPPAAWRTKQCRNVEAVGRPDAERVKVYLSCGPKLNRAVYEDDWVYAFGEFPARGRLETRSRVPIGVKSDHAPYLSSDEQLNEEGKNVPPGSLFYLPERGAFGSHSFTYGAYGPANECYLQLWSYCSTWLSPLARATIRIPVVFGGARIVPLSETLRPRPNGALAIPFSNLSPVGATITSVAVRAAIPRAQVSVTRARARTRQVTFARTARPLVLPARRKRALRLRIPGAKLRLLRRSGPLQAAMVVTARSASGKRARARAMVTLAARR